MGIGKYSANAILCFAYGEKKPLLDNNIVRLYDKVFNVRSDKKKPTTDNELWEISEQLLPNEDFVNYNYGILDLCIDICAPKKPKCDLCPLTEICYYFNSTSTE